MEGIPPEILLEIASYNFYINVGAYIHKPTYLFREEIIANNKNLLSFTLVCKELCQFAENYLYKVLYFPNKVDMNIITKYQPNYVYVPWSNIQMEDMNKIMETDDFIFIYTNYGTRNKYHTYAYDNFEKKYKETNNSDEPFYLSKSDEHKEYKEIQKKIWYYENSELLKDPITILKRARQEVYTICDTRVAGSTEIEGWYDLIDNTKLSGLYMVLGICNMKICCLFASELIKGNAQLYNIIDTCAKYHDSDVVYRGNIFRFGDIFEGIYLPDLSKIRKITIYGGEIKTNCIIYEQLYPESTTVMHIGGQAQYDVILIGNYGIPLVCLPFHEITVDIHTTEEIDVDDIGIIYSFANPEFRRICASLSMECSFQEGRLCRITGGEIHNLKSTFYIQPFYMLFIK